MELSEQAIHCWKLQSIQGRVTLSVKRLRADADHMWSAAVPVLRRVPERTPEHPRRIFFNDKKNTLVGSIQDHPLSVCDFVLQDDVRKMMLESDIQWWMELKRELQHVNCDVEGVSLHKEKRPPRKVKVVDLDRPPDLVHYTNVKSWSR